METTNRLALEKSPYLLQHAHNPVDWYPWGEEPFRRAAAEGKLVFLSSGYSTCHWCHVMARESFSDPEIAAFLNQHFISIKVDREERPDVDGVYMDFCLLLTGTGGWPLSVFLTPDKIPVFAGTYFPPRRCNGRPGFLELLQRLVKLWEEDRGELAEKGRALVTILQNRTGKREENDPDLNLLRRGARQLADGYDGKWGGFGRAPKFPLPHVLLFLLRWYRRSGEENAREMVENTLDQMARGGIFDHVGGGFHRYSTGPDWRLPHFEKMLYDQALLSLVYTDAFQVTGKEGYRRIVEKTLAYVLRELRGAEGAFYTAQDAESEGEEGRYYLWARDEILDVLGKETGEEFCACYQVEEEGNFLEEATLKRTGLNVLHRREEAGAMEESLTKLFTRRKERAAPAVDDKILTSWNGLMISALARAGRVMRRDDYLQTAEEAADFLLAEMQTGDRLFRRYRQGEAAVAAFLDDYAFFVRGLLELYQATFRSRYAEKAAGLTRVMLELFTSGDGSLYYTPAGRGKGELPLRQKGLEEGAIPSPGAVAAENLLSLAVLTGNQEWKRRGIAVIKSAEGLDDYPSAYPHLLSVVDRALGPEMTLILTGTLPETLSFRRVVDEFYLPDLLLAYRPPGTGADLPATFWPLLRDYPGREKARAYLCVDRACRPPAEESAGLREMLHHL